MARFQFRSKKAAAADDGLPDGASPSGSAAVLAARFGVAGGGGEGATGGRFSRLRGLKLPLPFKRKPKAADELAVADPFAEPPPRRRVDAKALAFPLAASLVALAVAGTAGWLVWRAPKTLATLDRVGQGEGQVPVLLPDGSKRFPDTVAPEAAPVDPVDLPVELAPSRQDALLERGRPGLLPKVGADGAKPWQAYARPFPQDDPRPRIAIVVTGLGQSDAATDNAVARLPGAVSFAFVTGVPGLQERVDAARKDGHEVLLSVPMEPLGYPRNDPGRGTLLTRLSDEENMRRLEDVMASATGYVGLTSRTDTGTRFLTQAASLNPVLAQLQRRGLLYLDLWQVADSQATRIATRLGLPRAVSDLQVDRVASPNGIDAQLAELERLAKANGVAVGFAEAANPVSIDRLAAWGATLKDRGIVLAPVSAVVNRQADR